MKRLFASLTLAGFASLAPVAAQAASADDAATKAYTLNLDKLTRAAAAYQELERAVAMDPALPQEFEAYGQEDDFTFADKRAAFAKHPKIWAFFARKGLTPDDVIVGFKAAANAYVASVSPTPQIFAELVSPAQLAFAKQNQAALQKIMGQAN